MRCKDRERGFTLIEMLVAASLVVLVVSAVYGAFAAVSRSTVRGTVSADRFQQGRMFLDRLGRQLRCAVGNPAGRDEKDAAEGKEKNGKRGCFQGGVGETDEALICFFTTVSLWPEAGSDSAVYEVAYRLDRREGIVWYAQQMVMGKERGERQWQKIGEDIAALTFMFFDGTKWRESCSSSEESTLPAAVKVKIEYSDGADGVIPLEITVHPASYGKREMVQEKYEKTSQ